MARRAPGGRWRTRRRAWETPCSANRPRRAPRESRPPRNQGGPSERLIRLGQAEFVGLRSGSEVKPSVAARECVLECRQHDQVTWTERRHVGIEPQLDWSYLAPSRCTQVAREELALRDQREQAKALWPGFVGRHIAQHSLSRVVERAGTPTPIPASMVETEQSLQTVVDLLPRARETDGNATPRCPAPTLTCLAAEVAALPGEPLLPRPLAKPKSGGRLCCCHVRIEVRSDAIGPGPAKEAGPGAGGVDALEPNCSRSGLDRRQGVRDRLSHRGLLAPGSQRLHAKEASGSDHAVSPAAGLAVMDKERSEAHKAEPVPNRHGVQRSGVGTAVSPPTKRPRGRHQRLAALHGEPVDCRAQQPDLVLGACDLECEPQRLGIAGPTLGARSARSEMAYITR